MRIKYCLDCNELKSPKGSYCKKCGYKHRTRPSGLRYLIVCKNKGWFRKGFLTDEKSPQWKGDNVNYGSLHDWVYRKKGKPVICIKCGSTKTIQWANRSHEYKREMDDWLSLCVFCHRQYDKGIKNAIRRRFS